MPLSVENSHLFRKIIDHAPQGMALFSGLSELIYANSAFYSLTGIHAQQWQEDNLLAIRQRFLSAGRQAAIEQTVGASGQLLTIQVTTTELDDNHVLCTLADITQSQNTIDTLTRRLNILQGLIDGTSASIFSFDKNFNYTSFNRSHRDEVKAGHGVDIVPGVNYLDIAGADAEKVSLIFQKVMAGETIETVEKFGDPDSYQGIFSMICNPIFDEKGQVAGMGVFCQDITERVQEQKDRDRLQEEVREKSIFLEGLLENLPVILYRIDASGIITRSVGAGLRAVPGWSNDLLVGLNGYELAKDMTGAFRKAVNGEPNRALNAFNINGQDFYFDTMVLPDSNCKGGIIGFAVDITAAKKAEGALAESHRQLKKQAGQLFFQNKFKDKILAIVSHDLRQPMAAIASASGLLGAAGATLSITDLNRVFNELNDIAHKSIHLLEGILCWVKSEKEGFIYHPHPLVLRDNITEANGIYRYEQQQKRITFTNEVPKELVVCAHKQMLLFINRNLISNATKYSSGGSSIRVDATASTNKITVSFIDEGPGMAAEELANLFKPDISADDIELNGSAGMALTICQDLVQCMGGRIWAELLPAKGTMFCYSLPVLEKE